MGGFKYGLALGKPGSFLVGLSFWQFLIRVGSEPARTNLGVKPGFTNSIILQIGNSPLRVIIQIPIFLTAGMQDYDGIKLVFVSKVIMIKVV